MKNGIYYLFNMLYDMEFNSKNLSEGTQILIIIFAIFFSVFIGGFLYVLIFKKKKNIK